MDSILTSVKKIIGIAEEDDSFDTDIIIHINTVFMILSQLGMESVDNFSISDKYALWSDIIPEGYSLEAIKTYVALKVRMIFDPPTGGVADAIKNNISELEWRINVAIENRKNNG